MGRADRDKPERCTMVTEQPFCKGENKVLAGVCSGIARHFDMDAVVIRVTAVVLFVCTFGLIVIPYAALALALPEPTRVTDPVDVDPLSIDSFRYERTASGARRDSGEYGVRADAGHVPPRPPHADAASQQGSAPYAAPVPTPEPEERPDRRRAYITVVLAAGVTAVFVAAAARLVSFIPDASLLGFWPLLLAVVGTVVLVCFSEKTSLGMRLCGLVLCIEGCLALLPFTSGVCPFSALAHLGPLTIVLWLAVVFCLLAVATTQRRILLVLAVGLLAVALAVSFFDIGLVERIYALSPYLHHNVATPLFRR